MMADGIEKQLRDLLQHVITPTADSRASLCVVVTGNVYISGGYAQCFAPKQGIAGVRSVESCAGAD